MFLVLPVYVLPQLNSAETTSQLKENQSVTIKSIHLESHLLRKNAKHLQVQLLKCEDLLLFSLLHNFKIF